MSIVKTFIALLLLCLLAMPGHAQLRGQERLDSLSAALPGLANDSERIRTITVMCREYSGINPAEGIRWAQQGLKLAQGLNWAKGEAGMWTNIGINKEAQSDYAGALEAFFKSLSIVEPLGIKLSAGIAYSNIGNVYYNQGELDKAMEYQLRALKAAEEAGSKNLMNNALGSLGNIYGAQKNYKKAVESIRKALVMSEEIGDFVNINAHTQNLAVTYSQAKDHVNALKYFKQSLELAKKSGLAQDIARGNANFGIAYLNVVENSTRKERSGLALSDNDSLLERAAHYLELGIAQSRAVGYKQLTQTASENLAKVRKLQGKYKAALLAFQQSAAVKDSVFNATASNRIARLEAQHTLDKQEQELSRSKEEAVALRRQRLVWYFVAGAILLLAVAGFFIYRNQRRRKEQLLKAEFDRRITEVEMQALRAQMNPHFIFNCLNSINRYIVKSDAETASDYLTKFSRLIRFILDSSAANSVPLATELQTLRLYAEMESLRFSNRFTFEIEADEDLRSETIFIPPMLVQPYVENAIWHGLMHKKDYGRLSVQFSEVRKGLLQAVVEDDGVGRARSAALKSKTATKAKSHGMKIAGDRLRIVNEQQGTKASIVIEDLQDASGIASGTRVTIQIPCSHVPAEESIFSLL